MSTDLDVNKVVYFHNPLEEPFTFRWDNQPTVIPGKTTVPLPLFLAKHGGKHLIDHIILHPETWAKLGLKRDDTEEKFDSEGKQIKVRSDLTKGREEIASLINVTGPATEMLNTFKAPEKIEEVKKGPGRPPKKEAEEEFPDLPKD